MYFLEQYKNIFLTQILSFQLPPGEGLSFGEAVEGKGTSKPTEAVDPKKLAERAGRLSFGIDAKLQNADARIAEIPKGESSLPHDSENTPQNIERLEMGSPAPLGNVSSKEDFSLGTKLLTPAEQKIISGLQDKSLTLESPEVLDLAKEMGMEEVLKTAGIDGVTNGEVLDVGTEASSPEQIQGSIDEIQSEQASIQEQISTLPAGSPERVALESRSSLLGGFVSSLNSILSGEQIGGNSTGTVGGSNEFGPDVIGNKDVISNAMKYKGAHERTGEADKFLMGMARSARETPWCAGFVSYVLKESGYNITPTLSSKAFIGETGKGHVAFYAGNGQMLGGNQQDQVSIAPINKPIKGWIMPEDLESRKPPQRGGTPPVGAVVVFDRGGGDRNMA